MSDAPLDDPRVSVDRYLIRPTGYDDLIHSDKDSWSLEVVNGHAWGWSIRRAHVTGGGSLNRKGEWIQETRGSKANRYRRWPLHEALSIALAHVDTLEINGYTAAQASAYIAARLASEVPA